MDFLNKLSINDDKAHAAPDTTSAQAPAQRSGGGLFENITNAIGEISASHSTPAPAPGPAPASPTAHNSESIIDKLGDMLYKQDATPASAPAPKKEEDGGLLGKISSVLYDGKHEPAPAPPKDEGLLSKISGAFAGHEEKPVVAEKNDEGLLGKIGGVFGNSGQHEEPAKSESIGDKINSMFGGGAAAEKEEGGLDKAVDFVQEHVFGAGPQKNESALEQLKDKHIAATIKDQFQKITGQQSQSSEKK